MKLKEGMPITPNTRHHEQPSPLFLLCARDIGAAGHILALNEGLKEAGFRTHLVLQGTASALVQIPLKVTIGYC